jgi:hypothetical protein
MSEPLEQALKYTVTFANGQTKVFKFPMFVVIEDSGVLKILNQNIKGPGTWHAPSAWRSLDVQLI